MYWNYDMESCPLDTKVCLLSSDDCLLLPKMEYVGTITFNGRFKTRGECYEGCKDFFIEVLLWHGNHIRRTPKMLTLPIKKKWFNMILSGKKKEREINAIYKH